jgi:hypothetical protein
MQWQGFFFHFSKPKLLAGMTSCKKRFGYVLHVGIKMVRTKNIQNSSLQPKKMYEIFG